MIDKFKEMPKSQIVAGVILLSLLPLMYVWYQSRKSVRTSTSVEEIQVVSTNSQYDSKLAAFKAKQKQQREMVAQPTLEADQIEVFSSEMVNESEQQPEHEIKAPIEKTTKAISEDVSPSKSARRTAPQVSAVHGLRQTVKDPETEVLHKPAVTYDQQAERRKEMMNGWSRNNQSTTQIGKAFKGVIHGTQELTSGQIANLRTKEEIRVQGVVIPPNTLISGTVRISSTRVIIDISSVRVRNDIYHISMSVYGSDGQPGLPTSIDVRDKAINKEITDEAISQVRRVGVVGSIASSVASAVTKDKQQKVKLIDSQSIYFKVNTK